MGFKPVVLTVLALAIMCLPFLLERVSLPMSASSPVSLKLFGENEPLRDGKELRTWARSLSKIFGIEQSNSKGIHSVGSPVPSPPKLPNEFSLQVPSGYRDLADRLAVQVTSGEQRWIGALDDLISGRTLSSDSQEIKIALRSRFSGSRSESVTFYLGTEAVLPIAVIDGSENITVPVVVRMSPLTREVLIGNRSSVAEVGRLSNWNMQNTARFSVQGDGTSSVLFLASYGSCSISRVSVDGSRRGVQLERWGVCLALAGASSYETLSVYVQSSNPDVSGYSLFVVTEERSEQLNWAKRVLREALGYVPLRERSAARPIVSQWLCKALTVNCNRLGDKDEA